MAEEVKQHPILVCPKCGKKIINKGIRVMADMETREGFNSTLEDFVLAVGGLQAAIICKACKVAVVPDNPQSKIILPDKKIVIARK